MTRFTIRNSISVALALLWAAVAMVSSVSAAFAVTVDGANTEWTASLSPVTQQTLQGGFADDGKLNALWYSDDANDGSGDGWALMITGSNSDSDNNNSIVIGLETDGSGVALADLSALADAEVDGDGDILSTPRDTTNPATTRVKQLILDSGSTFGTVTFDFPVDTVFIISDGPSSQPGAYDVALYTLNSSAAASSLLLVDGVLTDGTPTTTSGITVAFNNTPGGVETGQAGLATQDPLTDPFGVEIFVPDSFGLVDPFRGFAFVTSGDGFHSNQGLPPFPVAGGDSLPANMGSSTTDGTGSFNGNVPGSPDFDYTALSGQQFVVLTPPPVTSVTQWGLYN